MSSEILVLAELAAVAWCFGFALSLRPEGGWGRTVVGFAIAIGPYLAARYYWRGSGFYFQVVVFLRIALVAQTGAEVRLQMSKRGGAGRLAFVYGAFLLLNGCGSTEAPRAVRILLVVIAAALLLGILVLQAGRVVRPAMAVAACGAVVVVFVMALSLAEHFAVQWQATDRIMAEVRNSERVVSGERRGRASARMGHEGTSSGVCGTVARRERDVDGPRAGANGPVSGPRA
jgi:hypothetical protein